MISIEKALDLLDQNILKTTKTNVIATEDVLGFILAEDVFSPINMPPFRQAAMDGYAINYLENSTYTIIGEVQAGSSAHPTLKKGEAVRIFTGAAVPDSANVVLMQEKCTVVDEKLQPTGGINIGHHIRSIGEQTKKGALALPEGAKITAASIGFLIGLGITEISVFSKPSVGVVVTGNELKTPGSVLERGEIYESNGAMLTAAIKNAGFATISQYKVADNYQETVALFKELLSKHDFVLISGGISVGDYDYVGKALLENGVKEVFYKVKQKPGKPLFFGQLHPCNVFALPGNPASSLNCFYIYVLPSLKKFIGEQDYFSPRKQLKALNSFSKNDSRPQFLKALIEGDGIRVLDGQASSMIHSFAIANALIYLPEGESTIEPGAMVEVIPMP